jgi:hypothetical protein
MIAMRVLRIMITPIHLISSTSGECPRRSRLETDILRMLFLQQLSVMAWMYDADNVPVFREYDVQGSLYIVVPVASGAWIPKGWATPCCPAANGVARSALEYPALFCPGKKSFDLQGLILL